MNITGNNTGLAKLAVQCSAITFMAKIRHIAKQQTVITNYN